MIRSKTNRLRLAMTQAALAVGVACAASGPVGGAEVAGDAALEFFETRVRPVLVEQCYACHNSKDTAEGELRVDTRQGLRAGGVSGPAIVPGKPAESLLLQVVRHEVEGLEMPADGERLDERVLADLERWIRDGAVDPRDVPPSDAELAAATSWAATLEKRKAWWSFQPIEAPDVPHVEHPTWGRQPIDRFVLAGQREMGLQPNPRADRATLIRRLSYVLTGLPPEPARVAQFLNDSREDAWERLVDEYLGSRQFGVRWARHWMDWIRYTESHGSEGDPAIHNAWYYRDYLIRALNDDVPWDQLVREHVAGDLLPEPRINAALGINESNIGPAHWRMVFHGFAPTDALDEKVRFTDDQINAFTKAFLGLTVSCARCHDHKFDAIGQDDYYAMFGILASCRPGRVAIDTAARLQQGRAALQPLKRQLRDALARDWQAAVEALPARLASDERLRAAAEQDQHVLSLWWKTRQAEARGDDVGAVWQTHVAAWQRQDMAWQAHRQRDYDYRWDLANPADYQSWFAHGNGTLGEVSPAGEFAVAPDGDAALLGLYPAGVYSHALSTKHAARLTSPYIRLDDAYQLWIRGRGQGGASARYVVQHYPRDGTVYPVRNLPERWGWLQYDLTYWKGDEVHVEIAAGRDAPLLVRDNARSWFGVTEVVLVRDGQEPPPAEPPAAFGAVLTVSAEGQPATSDDVLVRYRAALQQALEAWRGGQASANAIRLLQECLEQGVLPNQIGALDEAGPLVRAYREAESQVIAPTRVPGLEETVGRDQALFHRGNHKEPRQAVARRFLAAIDDTPYATRQSGRRQLAEDLVRDDNPLTRRVLVNRIWHHVFGQGIVATPDNMGRLGAAPSHPRLLDYLATQFAERGWSAKQMIRAMVTSEAWCQSALVSDLARQQDPENQWLSHAHVRRLEAEAIRDAMLAVSGVLDPELYGPPVAENVPRRSVFLTVRRNSLNPFLRAFDFPEPFTCTGRRSVTNVPAQSLTMFNDPAIKELAGSWARRTLANTDLTSAADRLDLMHRQALGRPPDDAERQQATAYLAKLRAHYQEARRQRDMLVARETRLAAELDALEQPVRTQLAGASERRQEDIVERTLQPVARWEFNENVEDNRGTAHGVVQGGARIEAGALVVDGANDFVLTSPLPFDLEAKTLEAWVQLDSLDQRGGGVMTVQTPDGAVFDAIVFAEKDPGQWLAGSNVFARTQSWNGSAEQAAVTEPIHVATVYQADGTIIGYRNGQVYGEPYRSNGPQRFERGQAVVGFGVRHLPAGGNRMLAGRILEARLYDRALSADEIALSAASVTGYVSEAQLVAAMAPAQRQHRETLLRAIGETREAIRALERLPAGDIELLVWQDWARVVFSLKEFIYLR